MDISIVACQESIRSMRSISSSIRRRIRLKRWWISALWLAKGNWGDWLAADVCHWIFPTPESTLLLTRITLVLGTKYVAARLWWVAHTLARKGLVWKSESWIWFFSHQYMIVLKQLYLRACVCMSLYLYNVVVYSLVLAVRWAPSLVTDPLDTSCLTKDWHQLSSFVYSFFVI